MGSWAAWSLLATFVLVSTHTTPTFPYKLVCSAVIFRALPLEDVPGFLQLSSAIGIVPPRACSITFSAYTTLLEIHPFILEAHSVCPEHLGLNKSVTISCLSVIHKPFRRSLRPRKAPILYGVIRQAIVLKCTISNTWLVRLTRRSRVSVWSRCSRLALLYHSRFGPSLAVIGPSLAPFHKSSLRLKVRSSRAKTFSSNGYHAHNTIQQHPQGLSSLLGFHDAYHNQFSCHIS